MELYFVWWPGNNPPEEQLMGISLTQEGAEEIIEKCLPSYRDELYWTKKAFNGIDEAIA